RGCVVCGAPPISCEAHHLVHWIDGGATKLCNLVLLCKAHHIALHAGRWTITLADGTVQVERPTWADPDPTTRIRYRPPPAPPPRTANAAPTGSTEDRPGSTTAPNTAAVNPWGDTPTPVAGPTGDTTPTDDTTPVDATFDPWGDLPAAGSTGSTTPISKASPVDAAAFDRLATRPRPDRPVTAHPPARRTR
ncbi:MAG TPA: HNH endonuclease, partial [Kribbella sp.]|uniref:HNH endonuclease signature motif containing protein n=1 Tax=Kribbella sp. TaxID=1871183 RepID=UPI002D79AC51